jgi:predicted aspartyl protease
MLAVNVIPFTLTGGLVTVDATAAGRPLRMVVDLGAGVDVISAKAAARLGVTGDGRYTTWRMEGERVDLPTTTLPAIALGTIKIEDATAAIWPALDDSGIDGLIAATAFRDRPVTFDYGAHQLTVEDPASFAARTHSEQRVPIEVSDDRGISLGIFASFDFGKNQHGLCEIDTGSQGIFLDKRFAAKLGIDLADHSENIFTARLGTASPQRSQSWR